MTETNKATVNQTRYDKANTFRIAIKLNNKTDSDIKSWINSIKESGKMPLQQYIKRLIRADISRYENSGTKIEEHLNSLNEK